MELHTSTFGENYQRYRKAVQLLSVLDCLFSLASVAKHHGYCKPEIYDDVDISYIQIKQARHPVIHHLIAEQQQYVPNDADLHSDGRRVMIITGPNMGGKSSYIKQVALISILAQMGSFVPADSAKLSVFDAVYTRMGAADEIFRGRSTFMVELQEASQIMAQATSRSLVILDELGRGTSTHDGVAIAYSVLDFFINKPKCLTLFVTHYPMLAEFENLYPDHVGNYHMSFFLNEEESNEEVITFLYQLVSGMAERSYGLNVAKLANIPSDIVKRATQKSHFLEEKVLSRRRQLDLFRDLLNTQADSSPENVKRFLEGP
ncbi:hypothetical protein CHS0354_022309 [Potamilus streckersoni]|uniref:DNA mismatch repair proteins mutS family domain-containing protein n=1 Tax=Potamilus streckersoni TaxID=2493646 RepID=A0AAE0WEB7_9BIVA|nr:hypothetical protein CHS0354_022309 [Potamilus streckersoni]